MRGLARAAVLCKQRAAARGGFIKLRGANSPLVVALGVVWGGVGEGVSLAPRCAASEA